MAEQENNECLIVDEEVREAQARTLVTQCPICGQEFRNPRVLDCIHTFCLDCLADYAKKEGKKPGQQLPCPTCRKQLTIPENGVEYLPKDIFMEHLLEMSGLEKANADRIFCQVCDLEEDTPSHAQGTNRAAVYCLDCRQYHCVRCSRHHAKQRFSQTHEMVELGKKISADVIKRVKTYCDQHRDKQVEFYCYDCRVTFCMSCYVIRHNTHKSCDIGEIAKKFYDNVQADIGRVMDITGDCELEATCAVALKNEFLHDVENVRAKIKNDAEKLRRFISEQEEKLLGDLEDLQDMNLNRIKVRMRDIRQHITMLDNFKQYIMEVKEKATPADVSRIGCALHERANELHTIPYDVDFTLDKIRYEHGDFPATVDRDRNLIGSVTVRPLSFDGRNHAVAAGSADSVPGSSTDANNVPSSQRKDQDATEQETVIKDEPPDQYSSEPSTSTFRSTDILLKVVNTVLKGAEIQGITELNSELHVVRKPARAASAVEPVIDVEVYSMQTFDLIRLLAVPSLDDPRDMTSCRHLKCLYISDASKCCIHRINLTGSVQKNWPTCDEPNCLSVCSSLNVLVTCSRSNLIKEYRTDGHLIREINLSEIGMSSPIHTVELESKLLVVCHGSGSNYKVSLTDVDGFVLGTYEGSAQNILGRLAYLTVFHKEYVFVADSKNRRILLLPSTLAHDELLLSKTELMKNPFRMVVVGDILFVADNFQSEGRVLMFEYNNQYG